MEQYFLKARIALQTYLNNQYFLSTELPSFEVYEHSSDVIVVREHHEVSLIFTSYDFTIDFIDTLKKNLEIIKSFQRLNTKVSPFIVDFDDSGHFLDKHCELITDEVFDYQPFSVLPFDVIQHEGKFITQHHKLKVPSSVFKSTEDIEIIKTFRCIDSKYEEFQFYNELQFEIFYVLLNNLKESFDKATTWANDFVHFTKTQLIHEDRAINALDIERFFSGVARTWEWDYGELPKHLIDRPNEMKQLHEMYIKYQAVMVHGGKQTGKKTLQLQFGYKMHQLGERVVYMNDKSYIDLCIKLKLKTLVLAELQNKQDRQAVDRLKQYPFLKLMIISKVPDASMRRMKLEPIKNTQEMIQVFEKRVNPKYHSVSKILINKIKDRPTTLFSLIKFIESKNCETFTLKHLMKSKFVKNFNIK